MNTLDVVEKATVGRRPGTLGTTSPVAVAAERDFEHAAHETHRSGARMLLDDASTGPARKRQKDRTRLIRLAALARTGQRMKRCRLFFTCTLG